MHKLDLALTRLSHSLQLYCKLRYFTLLSEASRNLPIKYIYIYLRLPLPSGMAMLHLSSNLTRMQLDLALPQRSDRVEILERKPKGQGHVKTHELFTLQTCAV